MKNVAVIIGLAALIFLSFCTSAFCARGGHGGGHRGGGHSYHGGGHYYRGGGHYYRGGGYYYRGGGTRTYYIGRYYGPSYSYAPYAYGYSDPYYPYVYDGPMPYAGPAPQAYVFYCQNPEGYYPDVQNCPGGWTRATPASP